MKTSTERIERKENFASRYFILLISVYIVPLIGLAIAFALIFTLVVATMGAAVLILPLMAIYGLSDLPIEQRSIILTAFYTFPTLAIAIIPAALLGKASVVRRVLGYLLFLIVGSASAGAFCMMLFAGGDLPIAPLAIIVVLLICSSGFLVFWKRRYEPEKIDFKEDIDLSTIGIFTSLESWIESMAFAERDPRRKAEYWEKHPYEDAHIYVPKKAKNLPWLMVKDGDCIQFVNNRFNKNGTEFIDAYDKLTKSQ